MRCIKRFSLALAFLALAVVPSFAAAALVHRAEGGQLGGTATTSLASGALTNTAGNVLIFGVFNAGGTVTVSDLGGNTWHRLGTQFTGVNATTYDIFYAYNINARTNNVVTAISSVATAYWTVTLDEVSGLGTYNPGGDFKTGTDPTGVTAPSTAALGQTGPSSYVFGLAYNTIGGWSNGTLTAFTNGTWSSSGDGYAIVSSGPFTPTMIAGGTFAGWSMVAGMFNTATTPPSTGNGLMFRPIP